MNIRPPAPQGRGFALTRNAFGVSGARRYHRRDMNLRGETHHEPEVASERVPWRVVASEKTPRARDVVFGRERKQQRDEDARRFVEVAVRVAGGADAARARVLRRLEAVRGQIDALPAFDPKLQEEYEFLKAQQEALAARPEREVVPPKPVEIPSPAQPERADAVAASWLDRLRSGWGSLKERLLRTAAPTEKRTGTTAYEQTWTAERRAQRDVDRAQEMASVQERAVDLLQGKLAREQDRIKTVSDILSRRRREPIPPDIRARYVAEIQTLQEHAKNTTRLLTIAKASYDRQQRLRKAG